MVGIVAFGAYVPRLRLNRQAVYDANKWFAPGLRGLAKGERSMANWDEDSITMAVEAARDMGLSDIVVFAGHRSDIRDIYAVSDVVVSLSSKPESFGRTVLEPLAMGVFRIFQEMLSNVARHAQATEVCIRIRATPAELTVLVKDNGKGAPPSAFESHNAFGVMGMRERAGHFGGWVQIDSEPGRGTQVILSVPLRPRPKVPHRAVMGYRESPA